ncbi:HEXXH motif-containing putative peptide modification protein [Streptomyces sp. NPDC047072]|uniref:aKG-HExxH-type peptide beta-hydroxylase n=1 Tax=Streptomyces sp. NPDC047072 TaxID=3154809 RepID=UPI0033F75D65
MFPAVPERAIAELGRTDPSPGTLALLVRDQDTRRLLMLRALLDAAAAADPAVCSRAQKSRLAEDWALLTEADRRRPSDAGGAAGRAQPLSPARVRLLYPLTGPWLGHCLRRLTAEHRRSPQLARDLAHFSALVAAAAARADLPFSVRLTARDGVLTLPSLGALRTAARGDVDVDVTYRSQTLRLRQSETPDVTVYLESDVGAWSGSPAWQTAYALPGLVPDAPPMPLDDLDPYRAARDPRHRALSGPVTLDDAERKRWLQVWTGTATALRQAGAHRVATAKALLRCLVPLAQPPGAGSRGSCSATRREAFGALLSSTPPDPVTFGATLVHELHHAQLAALGEMVTLHQATSEERYFAPWRPDARPYDGLLQGAYSHLAIADYYQRRALAEETADRQSAWAQYARYRAQVRAALPALVGSPDLTAPGRRFVDEMVGAYERMDAHPAPRDHTARAEAYVRAARVLWSQRHAPTSPPNE